MRRIIPVILFVPPLLAINTPDVCAAPLIREGSVIIEAKATLEYSDAALPMRIMIESDEGLLDSFIALPNQRLQEMEAAIEKDPRALFQISGDVFNFGNENYMLLRESLLLQEFAERNHPDFVPIGPNATTLPENADKDSISDIVKELEMATGGLVKSIRSAAANPIETKGLHTEGTRIRARRCHLVRNKQGAWVAVFVSDASGLSDPPATVLPSNAFQGLVQWAANHPASTPVLLTGELMTYHGHSFLVLKSWRRVHKTDHIG